MDYIHIEREPNAVDDIYIGPEQNEQAPPPIPSHSSVSQNLNQEKPSMQNQRSMNETARKQLSLKLAQEAMEARRKKTEQ